MKHKLMIKTHNVTGLKYLCYTRTDNEQYENYKGSGKIWKRHLKKYGDDISTELIFETSDFSEFKQIAIQKSIEYDIVNSEQWANLKIEEGDGGDTVSNRMWITDGQIDQYVFKSSIIPEGWRKGRANCVFNDRKQQQIFANRVDRIKQGEAIKKAWENGKFDNRPLRDISGELNPAKQKNVREKISIAQKRNAIQIAERAKRVKPWEYRWKKLNSNTSMKSTED